VLSSFSLVYLFITDVIMFGDGTIEFGSSFSSLVLLMYLLLSWVLLSSLVYLFVTDVVMFGDWYH
ncbi:24257_t:CDS:2, partial [Gigaspora rosea]